jgi:hypothetical protein
MTETNGAAKPTVVVVGAGYGDRDRAVMVDPHVVTASGEEISADFIVLATGSRYPFPAKTDRGVAIAVPIGPTGGAGQFPGQNQIVGRETISEVKGRDVMVDQFGEVFGLATSAVR